MQWNLRCREEHRGKKRWLVTGQEVTWWMAGEEKNKGEKAEKEKI